MPNITPWTNFHELNLDWILQKMQELETKVNNIVGGSTPETADPLMDGTASPGSASTYSRGDHVHPTDTSRASASALNDLDTREYNDYNTLNADINTVDAKIAFTSAAPLVDGVASSGSSAYQARSDHVHPTDTSRASQTQVDSIQAFVDQWQGATSPYGLTPEMDGVGSAGAINAYSRGDHVHPSDTSKLSLTGGHITGDLEVDGVFLPHDQNTYFETENAVGWLRVAKLPTPFAGCDLDIKTGRYVDNANLYNENHFINLKISKTVGYFRNELSEGDGLAINQIRFTDAGFIDIHIDQSDALFVGFSMNRSTPTKEQYDDLYCLATPYWVDAAPDGETVLGSFTFNKKTEISGSITGLGKTWYMYRYRGVVLFVATADASEDIAAGSHTIGTINTLYRPPAGVYIPSANNPNAYLTLTTGGSLVLVNSSAITTGDPLAFSASWPKSN